MAIPRIPMPLNLVVRLKSVGIRAIDVQTGVKHCNPADNQVEKSGHLPAILEVRMPGCPLILYFGLYISDPAQKYLTLAIIRVGTLSFVSLSP